MKEYQTLEGDAVSEESKRLVDAAVFALVRAEDTGCYPAEEKLRVIAAEVTVAALLAHIASLESTVAALTKENADNQRQLLIAEGVTEKLDDSNAALRTENESLRQDAERLDWLENSPNASRPIARVDWSSEPRSLRKFIDAARASLTAGSQTRDEMIEEAEEDLRIEKEFLRDLRGELAAVEADVRAAQADVDFTTEKLNDLRTVTAGSDE